MTPDPASKLITVEEVAAIVDCHADHPAAVAIEKLVNKRLPAHNNLMMGLGLAEAWATVRADNSAHSLT